MPVANLLIKPLNPLSLHDEPGFISHTRGNPKLNYAVYRHWPSGGVVVVEYGSLAFNLIHADVSGHYSRLNY